uniref:Uncharacterized protein n=1 Tax=Athene cunicularia TaxID=194338 RepID=A0A663NCN9_ATHCN
HSTLILSRLCFNTFFSLYYSFWESLWLKWNGFDLKFSLESVKKLKELMDENRYINRRMVVPMSSYSPLSQYLPLSVSKTCMVILELAASGRCTHLMKMGASWLLKCSGC